MTPFLSFLGAAALVAAPLTPGGPQRDHYQKVADGLPWKDRTAKPLRSIAEQLPGYTIEVTVAAAAGVQRTTVRVLAGGKELCAWEEHGHGVVLVREGVLYRADYDQISSGCAIVAFDLKAGKELWKVTLKGLGPVDHSKYRNRVWLERLDDAVFAVYGDESAGRYVELVEYKTGRTVGHKTYPRE